MTATGADASAAWENPLIPNAKLRQIYLAMMRARALGRALPPGRREGLGLEAILVSTSVDLGQGDLVSDSLSGPVVQFLRGASLDAALRPVGAKGSGKRRAIGDADCGTPRRLPNAPEIEQRLWLALGAAAAEKAEAELTRQQAKAAGTLAIQAGLVVAYAKAGEVSTALWRKVLTYTAKHDLPVLFVLLPAASPKGSKAKATKAGMDALALECGIPGIAVDMDDAVAIYRVAQESIGRARIGGGAVLMECVPFVPVSAKGNVKTADAMAAIEQSLLSRGVVTRKWMERETKSFNKRIER
jgi:TPP-dependent pyruvate/acetoin dehydrogenase alpha subunit